MPEQVSKVHRGQGRVAFLARVDDFRNLLDAGHPLRSIYNDHKDQLGIGYPQFTKYVSRYIRKAKDDGHQKKGSTEGQKPASQQGHSTAPTGATGGTVGASDSPDTKTQPGAKRPGFQHDPDSGNKRDDLI